VTNNSIVLDTNISIDILKDKFAFKDFTSQYPNSFFYVSFMTRVELFSDPKLTKHDEKNIKQLFSIIPIIPYDENIEQLAIVIRRNSHLKIPDAFIAATALACNAMLITNDNQLLKLNWSGLSIRSIIKQNLLP
jgi:predicted nucleic acid-binding protein